MEARGKTIEQWFSMVQQGQILLPRFQRHEAWSQRQIVGLLDNILRKPSLPIGALLVLEVGDKELFFSRPIVGAPQPSGKPQMHLLDGQQRMTAIWRALTGDYTDLSIFVPLQAKTANEEENPGDQVDDAPEVQSEKRWQKSLKGQTYKMPMWADDDAQVYERGLLPIQCLCPGLRGEERLKRYMSVVAAAGDISAVLSLSTRISELRQRVAGYMIPFLSLPVGTGKETALDVFIKMNTSASPLSDFDIVVAQLEEAMGESLHDKLEDLKKEVPTLASYGRVEDNVLAVAALLNGKAALKTTYLDKDFGRQLATVWPRLTNGFKRGLAHLRQEGILAEKVVPSEVAVYLTCALWADVPEHGFDHEGNARTLIRKALWRACCTNRYGKTATTRAHADYKILAAMIAGKADAGTPELFDDKVNPIPEDGELVNSGWPSRKDRLPRAILAVALRRGAIDFADNSPASPENILKREYHHIFPQAGFPDGTPETEINRALNCALITWRTNRKFSASTPTDYIKARADASSLGEDEIRHRLASHLVPYDEMMAADYATFLEARAKRVRQAIEALCDGREPFMGN